VQELLVYRMVWEIVLSQTKLSQTLVEAMEIGILKFQINFQCFILRLHSFRAT